MREKKEINTIVLPYSFYPFHSTISISVKMLQPSYIRWWRWAYIWTEVRNRKNHFRFPLLFFLCDKRKLLFFLFLSCDSLYLCLSIGLTDIKINWFFSTFFCCIPEYGYIKSIWTESERETMSKERHILMELK